MIAIFAKDLLETGKIVTIVIGLMIIIDFIQLRYKKEISKAITKRLWNQYLKALKKNRRKNKWKKVQRIWQTCSNSLRLKVLA